MLLVTATGLEPTTIEYGFTLKHVRNMIITYSHGACSYFYKLVCVDDKFSKPFKFYLGEDAVYNFISSMIEESEYCSYVMKKHFIKELVMTEKVMKILRIILNVGSVIMLILMVMLR